MAPVLTIVGSLFLIYFSTFAYHLLVNFVKAKKTGFPYVIIPWNFENYLWMAISVPLRPFLSQHLPKWVWDRFKLTIYGWEFHDRLGPFEQFAAPQGDPLSLAVVHAGRFGVWTRDPEIVAEILRRPADFRQIDMAAVFMGRFGPNILTSDGESWSRQRKLVASVINERISKMVFHESIRQTEGFLDEVVGQKQAGESTRMFDMMKKITINVLNGAGMGTQVEWKESGQEELGSGKKMTYNQIVKSIVKAVSGPIVLPSWFLSNYPSFLPGYNMLNELNYAIQEFPKLTLNMLNQERLHSSGAQGNTKSNIMSQLVHASDQDEGNLKGGTALSEDEMVSNLFLVTAAGFDTTASALSYALVLLAKHPQWQEWVFEEVDRLMPADNSTDLDYASIFPNTLRTQALMLEVVRVFPPVIHTTRMTVTPQTIQTSRGSWHIPTESNLFINFVSIHLNPTVWRNLNLTKNEEPSETDELDFRPTRWIDQSTGSPQLYKPARGHFVPWSAGPRVCPGQKMAQVEFTAIFLKLFQKHRLEAVPLKTASGKLETRTEIENRLEARMRDSIPTITLQMNNVYDVEEGQEKGLKLRLVKR